MEGKGEVVVLVLVVEEEALRQVASSVEGDGVSDFYSSSRDAAMRYESEAGLPEVSGTRLNGVLGSRHLCWDEFQDTVE